MQNTGDPQIVRSRSRLREAAKRACDWAGIPRYWVTGNLAELRLLWVRVSGLLPQRRRKIARILRQHEVKLLLGCGETRYPDWVGIDCFFGPAVDLPLDLRRPLPFPTGSVDLCYSEHFLEHLYPDEGLAHLVEVRRILKPGGRYRIVVPDAIAFVSHYLAGDSEFFSLAAPSVNRPMEAIYQAVNWGGAHRNVLDFSELEHMAIQAGFVRAEPSSANASTDSRLRIDRMEPHRVAESLYVELCKVDGTA